MCSPGDHGETTESNLVLLQQEGQQHQHASIMNDPPHVYVAVGEAFTVGGETADVLWHQQGQTGHRRLSDRLCTVTTTFIYYSM